METTYTLTKSKFLLGFNCSKALWLVINEPEKASPISLGEQRIFEQGILVGKYARSQFPDGVLVIPDYNNLESSLEETISLINNKNTIFEGVFIFDEVLVKADILKPAGKNKWELIEVKSSTKVKDEHIPDIAIQKYVIENCGINIVSCKLMLINRECMYPDLSNLFFTEDVTDLVNEIMPIIPEKIDELKQVLVEKTSPLIGIGSHCNQTQGCRYKDFCWEPFGSRTIFHIPHLHYTKKEDLLAKGIILIDDIPDGYKLSANQEEFLNMLKTNRPVIDSSSISKVLSNLNYPIYFLDFETDNPAIPRFNGLHPYDVMPFQFSCHKLYKNDTVQHFDFLHIDETDPRKPFIDTLIKCLNSEGSIVVYNAGFEASRLKSFIEWFPELETQIQDILERLWDQLVIFRNYYKHPDFNSSNSIKSILPVLVPELSYNELEVKQGDDAQYIWVSLIKVNDATKKEKMINDLKAYCKMDTLAMLEIHKQLLKLNQSN